MAGRRRSKAARRRSSSEDGGAPSIPVRAPRARPKAKGSVALKISLTISGVVAASMIVFTVVLYQGFALALSDEVDETGILAVSAMAAVDSGAWSWDDGTPVEWRKGMSQLPSTPEDQRHAGWKIYKGDSEEEAFAKRLEANRARAEELASTKGVKILGAVVYNAAPPPNTKVICGEPMKIADFGEERPDSEVWITDTTYEKKGQAAQQARIYRKGIKDENGEVAGWAVIALSLKEIDARLSSLRTKAILLTVIFIGVGLLASWWVSQRITRPIALLADDIDLVSHGDLGHRTIAHTEDEIGVLARSFDQMTENLFDAQELEIKQAAQEHQIEVAQQVQSALFPERLPEIEGFEAAAEARSAGKIGGTLYDLMTLPSGAPLAVVASASSGGVPGAMVATMARSLIKAVAEKEDSPAEILRQVNRLLAPDLRRGLYVTVLMVRIDPSDSIATVANAGHHPLLICRRGAKSAEAFHSEGIALGFDKGPVFDQTIEDVQVAIGADDRLVLCTQSLFQVQNAEGQEIGEAPVYRALAAHSAKNSQAFVPLVMNALHRHQGGGTPPEDLALMTLKRSS